MSDLYLVSGIKISPVTNNQISSESGGLYVPPPSLPPQLTVNVGEFGIVGDGIADDTTAIQAALDAAGIRLQQAQDAGISGICAIDLPAGSYKISSTLTVRNGTTLRGQTQAPPYPNRLSGFKSNDNLFTGTEIVCSQDFVGTDAVLLEPDNTNLENIILDGHLVAAGTCWTQVNVTTAQGRWISTSFIKFPVQDEDDPRIQSFGFDNIEIPYFRIGEYGEFQLSGIGGDSGSYSFILLEGSLPDGLTLSSSGLISGTPTTLETRYPSFRISRGVEQFDRVFVMATILDELDTREILPATVGANYSFQFKTLHGEPGLTYKAIGMPDWLTLSQTGELTNNRLTEAEDVKHFDFKVELYDQASLLDRRAYHSELRYADGAIKIFGEQRLKPQTQEAFSYQYLAHGGYGDVSWSINEARSAIAGNATTVTTTSPYEGLTLNPATGEITGTVNTEGTNQYYLRATSNIDSSIFFEGLFYIEAKVAGVTPRIISRSFKTAIKGQPYSFRLNIEDIPAAAPYNYEAINLPTGLSIDNTGLITGTPTGANFVNGVRLQWSDSVKNCAIRGFRSGAGIYSGAGPSNVHRVQNCMISVCDAGIAVKSQAFDSHVTEMYIFNCRTGLDFGPGGAAWSFNAGVRIEYIHEDGANLRTAHENDLSGIFFDTCGWSAIRAFDCRNLLVTGCRFFRSGRNVRGIGTRLNPKTNAEYSNHVWLRNCKRATFTGNTFDIGSKEGGDGIYLTDHFADNLRPSVGFRIHNTPELTIVGNNLTGCLQTFSGNLSDFGANSYHGYNIANNAQSDRELVPLEVARLQEQSLLLPNNCFSVWQRDREFNIPVATNGTPSVFPIADGWLLKRGGNLGVDKNIIVSHASGAPVGTGDYLHLQKPKSDTFQDVQALELNNYLARKLEYTSNRSIIVSYYARSATGCSLGVKVSQYADSADNNYAAYQFQDNNRTISTSWKRYQHYFDLADLTGISLGSGAIFNLIFRCDRPEEDIDLDLTGVQIDFADRAPFAAPLRYLSFEEELAFALGRYQKSKAYDQYFPAWVDGYRYDVNGANWQPGFLNPFALDSDGNLLSSQVIFERPTLESPNSDNLTLLNPARLDSLTSSDRNHWSGTNTPLAVLKQANRAGFIATAAGSTVVERAGYALHWVFEI